MEERRTEPNGLPSVLKAFLQFPAALEAEAKRLKVSISLLSGRGWFNYLRLQTSRACSLDKRGVALIFHIILRLRDEEAGG